MSEAYNNFPSLLYRVRLIPDSVPIPYGVEVMCLGVESIDPKLEGHYDSVDALPEWVRERLALLMMFDATPPIPELVSVGRRISKYVFWVMAPEH